MIPAPYQYPPGPHQRSHGPDGWKDYRRYRDWLRDEFSFRCVYCLERETWRDMRIGMQIDHFEPQVRAPGLKGTYDNLLYLCPACNLLKGDAALPDPCSLPLDQCLRVDVDGRIVAMREEGDLMIEVLELDDERVVNHRRRIMGTVLSHAAMADDAQLTLWLGYPTKLPDLLGQSPPTNTRPDGARNCCYERRKQGKLPQLY